MKEPWKVFTAGLCDRPYPESGPVGGLGKPKLDLIPGMGRGGKLPVELAEITIDELSEITGFEKAWLRTMAARGYFPEIRAGAYRRFESLRAVLRLETARATGPRRIRQARFDAELDTHKANLRALNRLADKPPFTAWERTRDIMGRIEVIKSAGMIPSAGEVHEVIQLSRRVTGEVRRIIAGRPINPRKRA